MEKIDISAVSAAIPNLEDSLSISPDWGSFSVTGAQGAIGTTTGINGTGGYVYTTTNTSGYNWNIQQSPTTLSADGQIELRGKNADIKINDKSLCEWMAKVEERLNILTPNPELEQEWDDLRRLGERYRKLEKKCQEKAKMWQQLKSMPPPKVPK